MRMLDYYLILTAGVFWGYFSLVVIWPLIQSHMPKKNTRDEKAKATAFQEHLKALKLRGDELLGNNFKTRKPEVQKFQWRHDGKMNEVEIIIDPNINDLIPG